MPSKTDNLSILFADISGSTRLFEILGDVNARLAVSDTLELLTKIIHSYNGNVIKTIGDEVMCTFMDADTAANAAIEMQETLEEDSGVIRANGIKIKIRIGMHFGPALLEDGDVFGDAVNIAARMAAQAKGEQIITSKSTVDLLEPAIKAKTRFVDRASIKGKTKDIEIFEIIWQEEDMTRVGQMPQSLAEIAQVTLHLNYHNQSVTLERNKPGLVIGRGQACDFPVDEKLASRQHVRIELRRNKFFIIDQSTNGTYVKLDNNVESTFLHREEMVISSNGKISLGKSFADHPTEIINFTLQSI